MSSANNIKYQLVYLTFIVAQNFLKSYDQDVNLIFSFYITGILPYIVANTGFSFRVFLTLINLSPSLESIASIDLPFPLD